MFDFNVNPLGGHILYHKHMWKSHVVYKGSEFVRSPFTHFARIFKFNRTPNIRRIVIRLS